MLHLHTYCYSFNTNPIVSLSEPEPATSTSIVMTSASVPTGSMNVHKHSSYSSRWYYCQCSTWPDHNYSNIVVDQNAHQDELGVPALVSTLAIHDMASVVHVEEHDHSVSHMQLCFLALINNKQAQNFQSVPASFVMGDQVTQPADVTVSVQLGPIIIAQTLSDCPSWTRSPRSGFHFSDWWQCFHGTCRRTLQYITPV